MSDALLHLRIVAKNKILFEGEARSVSSHNNIGNFDILPEHASFISLIDNEVSFVDQAGGSQEFPIKQGLIKVIDNQVTVLIETAS
jgi:F-type H+-transporting ATPase subunit epsilon